MVRSARLVLLVGFVSCAPFQLPSAMARALWPAVKALSLDVTGTLLVHRAPIHETYAACAAWAKLDEAPSAEEIRPAFKEAFREISKTYPCFGHEEDLSSRDWWAKVVKATMQHCGREYPKADFERFFRRVYQHFGTLEAYEELKDAKPFLDWARQQGLAIGVTTNSDFRVVEDVLPMLGLHDHFKWFVCAREAGSEKPDPWIFVETHRQASFWVEGIKREEVLHIGDNLAADFCGARAAGLQAVLLDRSDNAKAVHYQDWHKSVDYPGKSEEDLKVWTLKDLGEVQDLLQRSIIQQLQ